VAGHYGLGFDLTGARDFCVLQSFQADFRAYPPHQWVQWALSSAVKRPGRGTDHSLPCCVEGRDRVEMYCCFHLRLHCVHRDSFTFTKIV